MNASTDQGSPGKEQKQRIGRGPILKLLFAGFAGGALTLFLPQTVRAASEFTDEGTQSLLNHDNSDLSIGTGDSYLIGNPDLLLDQGLGVFAEDMENEPGLQLMGYFQELVNSYRPPQKKNFNVNNTLGAFLKTALFDRTKMINTKLRAKLDLVNEYSEKLSEKNMAEKLSDRLFRAVNAIGAQHMKQREQPMQCVGLLQLLGGMNIIEDQPVAAMISGHAINQIGRAIVSSKATFSRDDAVVHIMRKLDLKEYIIGDAYVQDQPYGTGHIGVIIGKKEVDGETHLLVMEANRRENGKIEIFDVNAASADRVLGSNIKAGKAGKYFILRSNSNKS